MQLILTLVVALAGGAAALRLKVPAGAMIGAMFSVAVFNIFTGAAFFPQDMKLYTQIAAGAFIGAGISYKNVMEIKSIFRPAVIMVFLMLTLNLLMGFIAYKTTEMGLVTSLFAFAPGGIVDISLISGDFGADTSKVALMQLVRLIGVLTIFPTLLKFVSNVYNSKFNAVASPNGAEASDGQEKVNKDCSCGADPDEKGLPEKGVTGKSFEEKNALAIEPAGKDKFINLTLTIVTALGAGFAGYFMKIPAGALTLSMIGISVLNIYTGRACMPLNLRRLTQVFAGALIGEKMTFADLMSLKEIIIPAFILLFTLIVVNLLIGFLISKISGYDIATCLFGCAPAGVAEMSLIAQDLGADAPKVAVLQLIRLVSVIAFYPVLIKYFFIFF